MAIIDHYPFKLRRPGSPVDRDTISASEQQLGVSFPQSYVDVMLAHNGGSPSPAYLPHPGGATKVERIYSIGDNGLVETCLQHRVDHGLPDEFIPIAQLAGQDFLLLMECSAEAPGSLYSWFEPNLGFRFRDEEYSNVTQMYFDVAELPQKFGPAKNRKDRDGMFCQLYAIASNPAQGEKVAANYVDEGYDINFVLPTFRHPIFAAIDSDAFGVAAILLALGTRATHVDPLHSNATVEERLLEAQKRWSGLLEASREDQYTAGVGMATRRLSNIASALATIQASR